ncbi:LysR family transcriptional regulator [Shewanella loihica]|uniref:Transcriptional regulator, LysR family n=1 Tax=Shewanella loihica (strain ATCC BAA-1088 / PV-4) TaxID=323850 RepID=A3Q8V3_SHELP|nr:LysR family transcriptional regulator [Shewanella loihica]ABO21901.1 transcriptional regulator, LysR family [Shewanella loihica PV-4]
MDASQLYRMLVFASVVEHGSLTRAAESLNISRSMVSQHLKKLEHRCQSRLLNRTTRSLSLTQEGQSFYRYCAELLKLAKQAETSLQPADAELQGSITLAVPQALGDGEIAPIIKTFHQHYPKVHLSLLIQDRQLDLTEHQIDVAIQIGAASQPSVNETRLGRFDEYLVASPDYVAHHGAPVHPDNLSHHHWIGLAGDRLPRHWQFENSEGERVRLQLSPFINCNSLQGTLSLAMQGLGVALLPSPLISQHLANGQLVQLLPDYHLGRGALYLVHPYLEVIPPRVRALIELLTERLTPAA